MWDRLRTHWPRIKQVAFVGVVGFLVIFYGVLSHDDLPQSTDAYGTISGDEYASMLERDQDNTLLVDVRTEHAQKDVHANALASGVPYEEMGRHLAEQREDIKGKNLVFM